MSPVRSADGVEGDVWYKVLDADYFMHLLCICRALFSSGIKWVPEEKSALFAVMQHFLLP